MKILILFALILYFPSVVIAQEVTSSADYIISTTSSSSNTLTLTPTPTTTQLLQLITDINSSSVSFDTVISELIPPPPSVTDTTTLPNTTSPSAEASSSASPSILSTTTTTQTQTQTLPQPTTDATDIYQDGSSLPQSPSSSNAGGVIELHINNQSSSNGGSPKSTPTYLGPIAIVCSVACLSTIILVTVLAVQRKKAQRERMEKDRMELERQHSWGSTESLASSASKATPSMSQLHEIRVLGGLNHARRRTAGTGNGLSEGLDSSALHRQLHGRSSSGLPSGWAH